MKDDLRKAEQKWAQQRLFSPQPRRRRGYWFLLFVLLVLFAMLYRIADGIHLPPLT